MPSIHLAEASFRSPRAGTGKNIKSQVRTPVSMRLALHCRDRTPLQRFWSRALRRSALVIPDGTKISSSGAPPYPLAR